MPIFSKPNLKKKGKINSDSPPINQLILVFNNGVLQEWYSASGDLANSKPSYIRNTLTIGLGLAAISTFGISIILSIVSGS